MSKNNQKKSAPLFNYKLLFGSLLLVSIAINIFQNKDAIQNFFNPTSSTNTNKNPKPPVSKNNFKQSEVVNILNADVVKNGYQYNKAFDFITENPQNLKTIQQKDLPYDFRYLIKDFLNKPIHTDSIPQLDYLKKDKSVLFVSDNSQNYQANIFFNDNQNLTYNYLKNKISATNSNNIVYISGTYTTPQNSVAGLAINKGNVLNPFMQKWDGLLVVDPNGLIDVFDKKDIRIGLRSFNLNLHIKELRKFLDYTKSKNLSVIQSHLVVSNGMSLIDNDNKRKFRRRVIFKTKENLLCLYDSFNEQFTLKELSQILINDYDAQIAINLDMGTYNLGLIKEKQVIKDISNIDKQTSLSNVITIAF